jgi:hypothetical protein
MPSAPSSFVSRKGVLGGYEVTGWRYAEDATWHVKASRKSSHWLAKTYVVRDGAFDREPAIANEKTAILSLIGQWEAGLPETVSDFLDFNNPD